MKKVIEFKEPSCGLRPQGNYFARGNVKSTHYSIQSIRYLAPKIWDLVRDQIIHSGLLTTFKSFIKSWSPSGCSCRLHKIYILHTQAFFDQTKQ